MSYIMNQALEFKAGPTGSPRHLRQLMRADSLKLHSQGRLTPSGQLFLGSWVCVARLFHIRIAFQGAPQVVTKP